MANRSRNVASSCGPSFAVGEIVLAYHPHIDRIHNAKVLKVEFREGEWTYFVHFTSHLNAPIPDTWLTTNRLMKVTVDNILKQLAHNKGPAGSRAKRWQEAHDDHKRQKIEFEAAYETLREEFTANYGSEVEGIEEYVSFHINEKSKAPGERRARPDGGFHFERVMNGEESSQQQAAAIRGALRFKCAPPLH